MDEEGGEWGVVGMEWWAWSGGWRMGGGQVIYLTSVLGKTIMNTYVSVFVSSGRADPCRG